MILIICIFILFTLSWKRNCGLNGWIWVLPSWLN